MSARQFSSKSVCLGARLLAASTAITGALFMDGCSQDPDPTSAVYENVDACVADNIFTRDFCESSFEEAKEKHSSLAPVYESQEDCEKEWSDTSCEPVAQTQTTGNTDTFIYLGNTQHYSPRMTGYWVGRMPTSDGDSGAAPRRFAYPVYGSANNVYSPITSEYVGSLNSRISARPNFAMASESITAPRVSLGGGKFSFSAPSRSSFGGFGATARGFGGFRGAFVAS